MSKGRNLLAFMAALAVSSLLVLYTSHADKGPPLNGWMEQFTVIEYRLPAPTLPLKTAEGESVTLETFKGRVVLVNFWATWCAPCVREMPGLDKLQGAMGGKDFIVVAVNEDRNGETVGQPFLDKLGIKHLGLFVDNKTALMRAFKVRGLPTSYLLDRQGRIIGKLEGIAEWNTPEVEALIKYYMG